MIKLIFSAIMSLFAGVGIGFIILSLRDWIREHKTDGWECDYCKREIGAGEIYYSPKSLFLKRKKYCSKCDFGGHGYVRVGNEGGQRNGLL